MSACVDRPWHPYTGIFILCRRRTIVVYASLVPTKPIPALIALRDYPHPKSIARIPACRPGAQNQGRLLAESIIVSQLSHLSREESTTA